MFFQFTRLMLQLELATCRMSRGDFNSSVNLARGVLLDLARECHGIGFAM